MSGFREVAQCVYAVYTTGMIAANYVCLRNLVGIDELILLDYEQELSKRGIDVAKLSNKEMEGHNFQSWWESQLALQGQLH
jgi:hypothetical protein